MNKASKILLGLVAALAVVNLWQLQAGRGLQRRLDEVNRQIAELQPARPLADGGSSAAAPAPAPSQAAIEKQVQQLESEVLRLRAVANRGIQAEAELTEMKSRNSQQTPAQSTPTLNPALATAGSEPLINYLGEPVPPPPDMNEAYSKDGLVNAIQQAATAAGLSPLRIEIDTSEFPFLAGVICNNDAEFEKIKEQFKKMNAYEYGGSVSSHGVYAFTLVPYRAYPPESSERISRRTTLRQRVLFDQLLATQRKN